MSAPLTPSKRPHDRSLAEPNGKGKFQKCTSLSKASSGSIILRMVCPASKSGTFIKKGGAIISQIQHETGAKLRVEETIPASDERVIVIMGGPKLSSEETEVGSKQSDECNGKDAKVSEENEDKRESGKNDERKESNSLKDMKSVKESSALQKAFYLFLKEWLNLSQRQKEGSSVIKQMSSESGAQIHIIPRDKLPPFASATDELVQITGAVDAVRKALQSVSHQLLENSPKDHDTFTPAAAGQSSYSFGPGPAVYPSPNHSFSSRGAPNAVGPRDVAFHSAIPPPIPGRMMYPPDMLTFRLLCHHERVGSVIGKGGAIIKTITQETGSEIEVIEGPPDSTERIILIAGPVHPDDRISAAQDAVIRVLTRMARAMPDGNDKTVMARLLVSYNQIGCLLRKGGSVIAEMRKLSGAYIWILGKDQVPKCASEGDEVVQGFVAGGGPMVMPDFAGAPHRRSLGFGGGSQPAIITSTTVEVVVPCSIVPIIHGEDGACLKQIFQISDAKIMITEPKPGAAETVIIVSGTPEQTHAAQSLIQAFVISERDSISTF